MPCLRLECEKPFLNARQHYQRAGLSCWWEVNPLSEVYRRRLCWNNSVYLNLRCIAWDLIINLIALEIKLVMFNISFHKLEWARMEVLGFSKVSSPGTVDASSKFVLLAHYCYKPATTKSLVAGRPSSVFSIRATVKYKVSVTMCCL